MRWIEIFIDFGVPLLVAIFGLCLILRGLGKWRRKPQRLCFKCRYDMRATAGLTCPECGYAAASQDEVEYGKPKRWLVGLGVILILPVVFIAGFFAWYGPSVYYLRQHVQALESFRKSSRWPQVTVRYVDWSRVPDYWTVPGADWVWSREMRRGFYLHNRPDRPTFGTAGGFEFHFDYFVNMAFTPGRHYGRYFNLSMPDKVFVSNVIGQPGMSRRAGIVEANQLNKSRSIQPISDTELSSLLIPLSEFIVELDLDIDRQVGFSGKPFDGLTGVKHVSIKSDDLALVEWACSRPGLLSLSVVYQGPSLDAERIASSILSDGQSLESLMVKLETPHQITPQSFQGLLGLPKTEWLFLGSLQADVSKLPERIDLPDGPAFKTLMLNLVGCSDEQLVQLIRRTNHVGDLILDLNNSPVSDRGFDWFRGSSLRGLTLKNAPGVTFEKVGKLPRWVSVLSLINVGLTDAGLLVLDPVNVPTFVIDSCPVSDEGLIQFLKAAQELRTLDLRTRTPSPELVKQIADCAAGTLREVRLVNVKEETLDQFLASPTSGLTLIIWVDWDSKKSEEYVKKFRAAGMALRVGGAADAPP